MKFSDFKYFFLILIFFSCQKDIPYVEPFAFDPTYVFIEKPKGFPPPNIPSDNPITEEGIQLGKKLFYDKILSGNNTMSCANCHLQTSSFANNSQFNFGIDGILGNRNAMALINLAWSKNFSDERCSCSGAAAHESCKELL